MSRVAEDKIQTGWTNAYTIHRRADAGEIVLELASVRGCIVRNKAASADQDVQPEIAAQQIEHDGIVARLHSAQKFLNSAHFFSIDPDDNVSGPEAMYPRRAVPVHLCYYYSLRSSFRSSLEICHRCARELGYCFGLGTRHLQRLGNLDLGGERLAVSCQLKFYRLPDWHQSYLVA
jgi:hypothetical protein